jgi:ATP-dependent Clp protease ATP-binding subunit ClpB
MRNYPHFSNKGKGMRLEKLTENFREALTESQSYAIARDNQFIEPIHVMLSLLEQKSTVYNILQKTKINIQKLWDVINNAIDNLPKIEVSSGEVHISNDLLKLLNATNKLALQRNDRFIASELFLLAALDDKGVLGKILKDFNIIKSTIEQIINDIRKNEKIRNADDEKRYQTLDKYTIDITKRAASGKLDPVIGRDDEIRRTIQVLQRRTKNNPVLIGEPGVGKTAIAEGLAQRIINGEVPNDLKNKQLLALDMGMLIAGTKFRGEFEERFRGVINEITKADGQIILFIDELHIVIGAGKAEGSIDASNMLKPALARGELRCIGATTLNEYRQYIEKDAALERRFQKILINEPSISDTIAILRGLKEKYELHHGVDITDSAIVAAATMSHRYITDRNLPDKAIDLIDEAASRIKMEMNSEPENLDRLHRKIIQLKIEQEALKKEVDEASKKRLYDLEKQLSQLEEEHSQLEEIWQKEKSILQNAQKIKEELDQTKLEMDTAQRKLDLTKMSELQYGKIPTLEKQLQQALIVEKHGLHLVHNNVTEEEIAGVVSKWTGIPVNRMLEGEKEKLLQMENILHRRVIGQDEAIKVVANSIRRSRAGLSDTNKPIGSFMFLGPTGVGKTELCKTLAEFLFNTEEAIIRIDMSEFMEKHATSRLIGAPPGYVGYEEGGYLTEAVRRKPYSLILLDEIEKAHSDVFNILLQILDDGRLTDGHGRTVDFKNCIIIMTSNLGFEQIQELTASGYKKIRSSTMKAVSEHFRPEFINRIDEIIVFHNLDKKQIRVIANNQIEKLKKRLATQELYLEVSAEALDYLAKIGFDKVYGARPLKRIIQQYLENLLAHDILKGKFKPKDKIFIDYKNHNLNIGSEK